MTNPDLIPVPFAQDGDKNPIPLDRIISDPAYRATWLEGFPPDTRIPEEVGGEAPDGLDFNGLFNVISQAVVFLQKGNAYQFDASLAPYPIGALVRSNDNLTTYQSTIAGNSNDPNSNMTGWRVYNSSDFLVNDLTTGGTDKALTAEQGKILMASFEALKQASGYQKLPGGLIIQWGVIGCPANYTAGQVVTFNYPIAFPSFALLLVGSNYGMSSATPTESQALSKTQGQIYWGKNALNANELAFSYFAVGY